ncbi:MAG: deoxynucleoside kinase [Leptotrichiaceae bacterium]|nr:deoxynucleoside kinase [Leptotrichiaceae bacterium]MBP6281024.1 deoxynucleoside kinase [Leptotrichiaceae bacterium]MBP7100379.1 deoxynucleoside kinase [Leptotrichiaceae bacterium]MBP7725018.1 deoxynucleoside kinase [Leptotrichiaceae bacterium]MBP9629619.1 deoxynucleoside kinase [Leptotrichiaceae bacterium]
MGKLIIIEGTDGSGKQTQTELIYNKLTLLLGIEKIKKLSFPNYESKSSEPVKMYLSGEFGKNVEDVNAYAASILYSVDRFASFKTEWENFYNGGGVIISDRYTTSNMIHQASKIRDDSEREKYLKWLIDLEWNKIAIPKPDLVLFLDVPFEVSQRLIEERKNKITGDNKKDIHENNTEYLKNSYNIAKNLSEKYNWNVISCVENDKLKSIEDINNEIMNEIKKIL